MVWSDPRKDFSLFDQEQMKSHQAKENDMQHQSFDYNYKQKIVLTVIFVCTLSACTKGTEYVFYDESQNGSDQSGHDSADGEETRSPLPVEDSPSDPGTDQNIDPVNDNLCEPSSLFCADEFQLGECAASGLEFSSTPCTFGCSEALQEAACNECDPSLTAQCIGDAAVICSGEGTIASQTPCAAGECNQLTGQCNLCLPNSSFCNAEGGLAICDVDGTVGPSTDCAYGCTMTSATDASCNACTPESLECHGGLLATCNAVGQITSQTSCDYGCAIEANTDDRCHECTPNQKQCLGGDSVQCSPGGYITQTESCPYGCDEDTGACYACTPGTNECHGDDFVSCNSQGEIIFSENCTATIDACNAGSCQASGCAPAPVENGTACDDGKFCSLTSSCQNGICTQESVRTCDDGNDCTIDSCNEGLEACVFDDSSTEGNSCQDGQFCTENTICVSGNCEGGDTVDCDDGNPCSVDSCNENLDTCVNDATAAENASCGDDLICCSGSCIDSDEDNCGQCGNVCAEATGSCAATGASCLHGACIDEGILVITEVMIDPDNTGDTNGEWVEVYNASDQTIDLRDWIIGDDGSDSHTIGALNPIPIAPWSYGVLARNTNPTLNCGVSADYGYSSFSLGNSGDEVVLTAAGCVVDRISFSGTFDNPATTKQLDPDSMTAAANDATGNSEIWCDAQSAMTCGDYGTPGAENTDCQ